MRLARGGLLAIVLVLSACAPRATSAANPAATTAEWHVRGRVTELVANDGTACADARRPIAGARVTLACRRLDGSEPHDAHGTTDGDGRIDFFWRGDGSFTCDLAMTHADFIDQSYSFDIQRGRDEGDWPMVRRGHVYTFGEAGGKSCSSACPIALPADGSACALSGLHCE